MTPLPLLPGSRVTITAFYDVGWRPWHGENGGVGNKKKIVGPTLKKKLVKQE